MLQSREVGGFIPDIPSVEKNVVIKSALRKLQITKMFRGFFKGRALGKLTSCEHDFARLLYISKNFFLIQGTIKNSFKLQSCPFLDKSYRV